MLWKRRGVFFISRSRVVPGRPFKGWVSGLRQRRDTTRKRCPLCRFAPLAGLFFSNTAMGFDPRGTAHEFPPSFYCIGDRLVFLARRFQPVSVSEKIGTSPP